MQLTEATATAYSIRQLSPYRGTVQILSSAYARAVSADGVQWQIQVSCEVKQQQWGIMNSPKVQRRYVLYGMWNQQRDLSCLPLDPMLDVPDDKLIETSLLIPLRDRVKAIPFPATDQYELWLLHGRTHLPIALIASATSEHTLDQIRASRWRASSSRQQQFQPMRALCSSDPILKIESLISEHGSSPLTAQWFYREADRSGLGLGGTQVAETLTGRKLSAEAFPELLIAEDWPDDNDRLLAEDYHHWLSAQLLLLPHLRHATRKRLELAAQQHALTVSQLHHLYPAIADQKILNRILVEARLRKSSMT